MNTQRKFHHRQIDRRSFLQNAGLAAGFVIASGSSGSKVVSQDLQRRFAPVKVARDRVIREVVGLRPYRDEGYVVEAQKLGNKLLIHNYGHGGAGITLSWGTASEAVELARDFQSPAPGRPTRRSVQRRFAVIGCGVNGLSTAILLQRRYQDGPGTVTIYAKDLPPDTTSNIAGGYWMPTSLYDSASVTPKFIDRFKAAAHNSNRAFQLLVGPEYGVRWIDVLELNRGRPSTTESFPGGNDLYPNQFFYQDAEPRFGSPFVRQFSTMLIEPSKYLGVLLRDFYNAGGRLIVKEFRNRDEIMRLPESVIFNCSGLGAHQLFGDEKLVPARGQLVVMLPQPEVDYCYVGPGYMFPRSDGIILGGTFDRGDWSLSVNPEQSTRMLNTHAAAMKGFKG
jgi:glycine/D-amino acid oxidase-like deaminating enzyme